MKAKCRIELNKERSKTRNKIWSVASRCFLLNSWFFLHVTFHTICSLNLKSGVKKCYNSILTFDFNLCGHPCTATHEEHRSNKTLSRA